MQEQAKTATPTASRFQHLPSDVQHQIVQFLSSYEVITGIGSSARCLRNFCLPLVEEVCFVIPALDDAFYIAKKNGKEAGLALLPSNMHEWSDLSKRKGGKLAAGLLCHLPNIQAIYAWVWTPHFQAILGESICQLSGPRR